ncbi:MAG: hypothetical protein ACRDU8_10775 [Egibacteraceae bacterium]
MTDPYPAPRHPGYLLGQRVSSAEELVPIARDRAHRWYSRAGLAPVHSGDRVLIVTYPDQDRLVLDAVRAALLEMGAEDVDWLDVTDIGFSQQTYSAADGWREITDKLDAMTEQGVEFCMEATLLQRYLHDRSGYTSVYVGEAGRPHWRRTTSGAFRNNWLYNTYESFISRSHSVPDPLWQLIDQLVIERFRTAAAVRVTDPQGTDIGWQVTEEQAGLWADGALISGHILGSTIQGIRFAFGADEFIRQAEILMPTLNGVVAGTGNHTGYHPHITVTVERGMIASIQGGGRYGDLWREVMDRYRDVQYPGFPYKGWAYFNDASIGTNPKGHRHIEGLWANAQPWTNLPERTRAGVVHFGFGAEHWDRGFLDYAREHHLPTMHFPHVHSYFPTMAIRQRGSGEWVPVIDKGWLTVLDDPRVVRLAEIYGDPDEVLGYDWIPAIPQINYPGDYQRDYAADPVPWIDRDQQSEFADATSEQRVLQSVAVHQKLTSLMPPRGSVHRRAAIDDERLPGDEVAVGRQEEHHRSHHVLR